MNLFLAVIGAASVLGQVRIERGPEGVVKVQSGVYTASLDHHGDLTELRVGGSLALIHDFPPTGNASEEPPPAIKVDGNTVVVQRAEAKTHWTFAERSIHVVTEGYQFEGRVDDSVKAAIVPGGNGGPLTAGAYPGSRGLILANGRTVKYTMPLHVHGGRLFPTLYVNGSGTRPGDRLEFDLEMGGEPAPADLVSRVVLEPVGRDVEPILAGGNEASRVLPHFAAEKPIAFRSVQHNVGAQPVEVAYCFTVLDHYAAGREVYGQDKTATLDSEGSAGVDWQLPALPPGFYYATVTAAQGETPLTETRLTFTVDLPHYAHPLTRSDDFEPFWGRQDKRLRETPANAELRLVSRQSNPNRVYELKLDMPGGKTLRGCLLIPEDRSGETAELGSLLPTVLDQRFAEAAAADFAPKRGVVELILELPEDATYRRWESAADNNLLESILCYLRGTDYLASRPEVQGVRVRGASRSGPLAFITAARRPEIVVAVDAFIHTSAGLSWTDKPYRGWGLPPGHRPDNPEDVRSLAAMASYVDPVNHAPDVRCPVIFGWGLDDNLSPPQGIEAMYHHTASSWKRISRDVGGHQYSRGYQALQQQLSNLPTDEE